jgi:hypothetical protein
VAIAYRISQGVSSDAGGSPLTASYNEAGTTEIIVDQVIAASQTDLLVAMVFTTASLQAIEILADSNMTLETNSGGAPANTISLKAGIPFLWSKSPGYFANPFTVDVTAWYITNTASGRLRAKILK